MSAYTGTHMHSPTAWDQKPQLDSRPLKGLAEVAKLSPKARLVHQEGRWEILPSVHPARMLGIPLEDRAGHPKKRAERAHLGPHLGQEARGDGERRLS